MTLRTTALAKRGQPLIFDFSLFPKIKNQGLTPFPHAIRFLILTLATALLPLFGLAGDDALRLHMLSGTKEYKSEASLNAWAAHLESEYGITEVTMSHGPDRAEAVSGLENLETAEVLIIFCRRWELSGEQAAAIMDWIDAGKPILAIRTASHGFQFYLKFDHDVLGGDYSGHGKAGLPMEVVISAEAADHPVLSGIHPWERTGKLYRNPNPAEDITVLLNSVSETEEEPLAWVRTNGTQRVFTTAMGFPADFENPLFIQLLDNALFWVAGRETQNAFGDP